MKDSIQKLKIIGPCLFLLLACKTINHSASSTAKSASQRIYWIRSLNNMQTTGISYPNCAVELTTLLMKKSNYSDLAFSGGDVSWRYYPTIGTWYTLNLADSRGGNYTFGMYMDWSSPNCNLTQGSDRTKLAELKTQDGAVLLRLVGLYSASSGNEDLNEVEVQQLDR